MKFTNLFVVIFMFQSIQGFAQSDVVSGPWAGNVELRTAMVWAEVSPKVKTVSIKYFPVANPSAVKIVNYTGPLGNEFNPIKMALNGLEFNSTYTYSLIIDGKPLNRPYKTTFITKDLWQWRKPAPDFQFLAGSCAYFNEPVFDRPGKPYGADSSIFDTMAKTPAAFHIWMGDNWYTREVDYSSAWGLNYRVSRDRGQKILQGFMAAMPQYAIWDDHDYGPDNAGKSFILKEESRQLFQRYTLNPSYGQEGKGIYTKFSYSDVDFFLTDDRYFRSEPELRDSLDGWSIEKTFFGPAQMKWLQNSLLNSTAVFKIIVVGSQVLNPLNRGECLQAYKKEHQQLLSFLETHAIPGVIFFTGDQHHSEVIRIDRPALYPLFDVTISPYTAGISKARNENEKNPYRVGNTLTEVHNFGMISIAGPKDQRTLTVQFLGTRGEKLASWQVSEATLKTGKR